MKCWWRRGQSKRVRTDFVLYIVFGVYIVFEVYLIVAAVVVAGWWL